MSGPPLLSQRKEKEENFHCSIRLEALHGMVSGLTSKALVASDVLDAEKTLDPSTLI